MASPLATGGCFALKSKLNGKYMRYSPEKGKILEVSGEDVLNPYTRFRAELSKEHVGHVHIRCCYNNMYWVAREVENEWSLVGDANEPQEDLSDPSCTLLRHEPSSVNVDNVKLQHASLDRSVSILADAHPTKNTLRAGALLLGNKDKQDEDGYMFSVLDLEGQMVLPKNVCFKGDNGKFLRAKLVEGYNYLQFSSDDLADPAVRNIIHSNSDGTIRLYSSDYGKFWRNSHNWIWADSNDTTSKNRDTVFQAIFYGDTGDCALKNLGNNYFCQRLTTEGKTSCLNAAAPTIRKEAQLELHETILSRKIYGVKYHVKDAKVYGLKPRTYYNKTVTNRTSRPHISRLTIAYSVTTDRKWESSVNWKIAAKITFTAGVPEITQTSIEVSSEFGGAYNWGQTKSHTEHYSDSEDFEVPAHTALTIRVVATQGKCDIPFSYIQEDILTTGEKVVTKMDDGIFSGVNSFGFDTEVTEKKI